ncbi:hypothetical protein [Cupriavidus necator]
MDTIVRVFWDPKRGSSEEEYQDAFAPRERLDEYRCEPVQRFAVSDGASEAIYSGRWAQILTQAWCEGRLELSEGRTEDMAILGETWRQSIGDSELPWWAEEKIRSGSFATLVGLELHEGPCGSAWSCTAVGDSCWLLIRENQVMALGPLQKSADFSNNPYLLASNPSLMANLPTAVTTTSGILEKGDEFFLMSDAIAHWVVGKIEGQVLFNEWFPFFDARDSEEAFKDWVGTLRDSGEMRNDDITLMSVCVVSC